MTEVALDESQLAAVQIEPDERQIVIAGPGSGKTEVVSALIEHLTEEMDVDPVDGLLVISFSNAAVHAAESRLRAHGAAPVSVQTMDSLAAEILRELATEDHSGPGLRRQSRRSHASHGGGRMGPDRRPSASHRRRGPGRCRGPGGLPSVDHLRHAVRCWIQPARRSGSGDLRLPASTDTRRGRAPASTTTSAQLLESVAEAHAPTLRKLTGQYRASSRDSQAAMRLRDAALPEGDPTALEDFFADLVHLGRSRTPSTSWRLARVDSPAHGHERPGAGNRQRTSTPGRRRRDPPKRASSGRCQLGSGDVGRLDD